MKQLITTDLGSLSVAIIPAAQQAKDDALALAKPIVAVTNAQEQADAIAASAMMKSLTKQMEATREDVKKPVLEAGRLIDSTAKKYALELEAEIKRVEKLASDWQAEENRKAAAIRAEQERLDEADRERERKALADIAAKAEQERRANLAAIAAAADDAAREAAQIKADQDAEARAEEARINGEACAQAGRDRIEAMRSAAAEKPQAARVTTYTDYELKDIRALYAARPDLCELSEKRGMILAALSIPGHPAIPGLYEFQQTKVMAKAS